MLPGRDRIVGEHFRGDRLLHGASIYILRCSDGSDYTGVTRRSVDERVSEHAQGIDEGCCTFRRRPVGARGTLLSNRRRGGGRASHQGVVSSEEGSLYPRRLCRTHCTRKTERKTHVGAGMICSGSVLRGRFAAPQDEEAEGPATKAMCAAHPSISAVTCAATERDSPSRS